VLRGEGDLLLLQLLLRRQLIRAGEVDAAVAMEVQLESGGQGGLVVRGTGVRLHGHLVVEPGELVDQGPGLVLGERRLKGVQDVVQRDALFWRGAAVEGLQDERAGLARLLGMRTGGHGQLVRWQLVLGIAVGAVRRCGQEGVFLRVLELSTRGGCGRGLDLGGRRVRLLLGLVLRHYVCVRVWLSMAFNPIPLQTRHWPTYN